MMDNTQPFAGSRLQQLDRFREDIETSMILCWNLLGKMEVSLNRRKPEKIREWGTLIEAYTTLYRKTDKIVGERPISLQADPKEYSVEAMMRMNQYLGLLQDAGFCKVGPSKGFQLPLPTQK